MLSGRQEEDTRCGEGRRLRLENISDLNQLDAWPLLTQRQKQSLETFSDYGLMFVATFAIDVLSQRCWAAEQQENDKRSLELPS